MERRPFLLDCTVQQYAWGSTTALAALQHREPSGLPEAELWIGAHPNASSTEQGSGSRLDHLIEVQPGEALGEASRDAFGDSLPFLLKVLAAGAPLSLQAHPSRAQAEAGFDAEEGAGVPMADPRRVFKDRNHKPELICALTEFEAMCGFRPVQQTASLLESLATPVTLGMAARLRADHAAAALRHIVVDLLSAAPDHATRTVNEVIDACKGHTGAWAAEADLACRLAAAYAGDPGAVISLLLNRVVLKPGEALMLAAGNLHAYIQGVGVELMANSDNVLRGGLTPKHVDVPGLIEVVDWQPLADPVIHAVPVMDGSVSRYPSPSNEFRLDLVDPTGQTAVALQTVGPELLWCAAGLLEVSGPDGTISMSQGAAAFVPASVTQYQVSGEGRLFRATVGL